MILAPAPASLRPAESASALLASTYRRLTALCPGLDAEVAGPGAPAGQSWVDVAELALRPGLLDTFLEMEAARITQRYDHRARPDVVASRLLHDCLWSLCLLLSGPWYLDRRVPLPRPEDVRIGRCEDRYQVVPGTFACLPGDPAEGLPGVRRVSDEAALGDALRTAVADLVRPLCAALGPRVRRGPRALWGMVEDDLVSGIWYVGRMLGEEERAVGAAGRLLPGPVSPFPAGAGFRDLTGADGRSYPTRDRAGCCLYYTIRPAEACDTCPRTCDAERLRRIEAEATPAAG
ncbi:(2Fe-2S)-binding protein [Streptomyces sp. NBC_00887]|uniref:(2Fe-2S)-binding protein n=1 Tax=Streptomyces sp. NBC_00887 TaxID=2975859 RepID=UPI00386CF7B0|nr:(2Fe-2S)-binding protein [Streptomyces sp. NBC_00887]